MHTDFRVSEPAGPGLQRTQCLQGHSSEAQGQGRGPSPRSPGKTGKVSGELITHPGNLAAPGHRTQQDLDSVSNCLSSPSHCGPPLPPGIHPHSPSPGPQHPTDSPFSDTGGSATSSGNLRPQNAARSQLKCHSKR